MKEGIEDYENLEEKEQEKVKVQKRKYDEAYEILTELANAGSTYSRLIKAFEYLSD